MIRTYIDSGILIAAARGSGQLAERALAVLGDTDRREFVCSDYVRLEVVPKPAYHGRTLEVEFYEAYFSSVTVWAQFDVDHLRSAFDEACRAGLSSMDAIHVVVASRCQCDEFVTSEKPTKPIHRTALVRTVSIDTD